MRKAKKAIQILVIACMITFIGNAACVSMSGDEYAYGAVTTVSAMSNVKNTKVNWIGPQIYDEKSMYLDWGSVNNASGYEVYRATSKNGKYQRIATVKETYYIDSSVKFGKLYYYKIRAYKISGGSKTYSKFSTKKSIRMTVPSSEIKKVKIDSNGKVTCSYKKLKKASGYYIYHSTDGEHYTKVKTVIGNKNSTSFTLKKVPEENYFNVRGFITIGGKRYLGVENYYGYYYDRPITIKNTTIKNVLKKEIGNITRQSLREMDSLEFVPNKANNYKGYDLSKCTASDFAFLKYCINLSSIRIEQCKLSDFSIITENLPDNNKVDEVSLVSNCLTNLNGIAKLKKLKELYVSNNYLECLDGLEECSKLRWIEMDGNPIKSFSALDGLTHIEGINFWYDDFNWYEGKEPFGYTNYKGYIETCNKLGEPIEEKEKQWAAVETLMDEFIKNNITPNMSDYDKIKAAHDFICKSVTYGKKSKSEGCKKVSDEIPYCPLLEGHGICHDYTMAFGYLTARMGFETYYVYGYSHKLGTITEGEDHGWNIIKLEGNYYHVDCTWDDPTGGANVPKYEYFLKSDHTLQTLRGYKWYTDILPACPYDYK